VKMNAGAVLHALMASARDVAESWCRCGSARAALLSLLLSVSIFSRIYQLACVGPPPAVPDVAARPRPLTASWSDRLRLLPLPVLAIRSSPPQPAAAYTPSCCHRPPLLRAAVAAAPPSTLAAAIQRWRRPRLPPLSAVAWALPPRCVHLPCVSRLQPAAAPFHGAVSPSRKSAATTDLHALRRLTLTVMGGVQAAAGLDA